VASCNTRRTRWRIHGGGSGDANTWQDWLNESFAEYSAVLLMRDWHGRAVSGGILARYEREAQEAKPIWGFDRNDRSAQATLYRKGPAWIDFCITEALFGAAAPVPPRPEPAPSPPVEGNWRGAQHHHEGNVALELRIGGADTAELAWRMPRLALTHVATRNGAFLAPPRGQ
jgi:hypothetical protein